MSPAQRNRLPGPGWAVRLSASCPFRSTTTATGNRQQQQQQQHGNKSRARSIERRWEAVAGLCAGKSYGARVPVHSTRGTRDALMVKVFAQLIGRGPASELNNLLHLKTI